MTLVTPPRIDLNDASLFSDDAYLDVLAYLREHDPVHWHAEPGGSGFWAVTRYDGAAAVYLDHATFSSRFGMRLQNRIAVVEHVAGSMLVVSDPPEHARIRYVVAQAFTPARTAALEPQVHHVVAELLDEALEAGECDFVATVARRLPTRVICAMMALPRADWDMIGELTSDGLDSEDEAERVAANGEIFLYFSELLEERRARPGDDLISFLAVTPVKDGDGGGYLSDDEIIFNLSGILSGANETVRNAVAGGVAALCKQPAQERVLRAVRDVIPTAVDEILRWTSPVVHVLRTVTADTVLGGVPLRRGDRVTVWNAAANRDGRVFAEPDRLDLERRPNRHFAFGHGRHVCVGARLGRLEIGAFLHAFRERVAAFEQRGDVEWRASNFSRGPTRLVLRLHAA